MTSPAAGKKDGCGGRSQAKTTGLYILGAAEGPSQSHSRSECFWGTKDQRLGKGEPLSPLQPNLLFRGWGWGLTGT